MITNWTKLLCLIAFTLAVSGCGSGSSDSDSAAATDPQLPLDDTVDATEVAGSTDVADSTENVIDAGDDTEIAVVEVTNSTETNDGLATPVQPVSSGQMEAFVDNPLVTEIPAELNSGTSVTMSSNFITNPLMH